MDGKRIDSYLFNEMPETERSEFEDRFAGDDILFAEIAERENELVDRYVRNELSEGDRVRFERSLDTVPARKQKVANAAVIREFIASERENKTITIAERTGFFSRLAELFTFRSPAFQFASIGDDPQDKKYAGEPTRLAIGDRNTIREFCTLNRGTV